MNSKLFRVATTLLLLQPLLAGAHTPPRDARVFFIGLENGAVMSSPVMLQFGIEKFGITPAGTSGKLRHSAGHHHLLIDLEGPPDLDKVIPRDAHHLHFDRGETDTVLELPPGRHTLQLLLGDEEHEPHEPALLSNRITITVRGD